MPKNIYIILVITLLNINGTISIQSLILETTDETFNNFENKNYCKESEFPSTGFVYVDQDENGVWWFISPNGSKFYAEAIGGIEPSEFYYGNISIWTNQTDQLLKKMSVNTITTSDPFFQDYYYMGRFKFKQLSIVHTDGWSHNRIPDVFDPWWREQVKNTTKKYATIFKNDPKLIGYYTDNEMKWGPDIDDNRTMLEVYMAADNNTSGKQELIRFLKYDKYADNTTFFNLVWNMNITDFKELENLKEFGIKDAWRFRSSINFEKKKIMEQYPKYREDPNLMKQAEEDIRDFSRYVARTYFNITNSYLKAADPNHLNIGTRFHLFGVPIEVLEECGKFVDVISLNYYRSNIKIYDPFDYYTSLLYGCVPLDNWMKRYYEKTNRPLLVAEWNMKIKDRVFPLYTEDNRFSARITQKNRADNFEWYAENCLESPYMIGNTWFLFRDKGFGFGFGGHGGIVDLFDNIDEVLVDRMQKVYTNSTKKHEKSSININRQYEKIKYDYSYNIFEYYKDFLEKDTELNYKHNVIIKLNENQLSSCSNIKGNSKTIYVDDDSFYPGNGSKDWPYCKIKFAIENATSGDTIRVFNGTYNEKIIITKPLQLIGNNSSNTYLTGIYEDDLFVGPLDIEFNNNIITILSENVQIKGFNIVTGEGSYEGSSGGSRICVGIEIFNSTNCEITNNSLENNTGIKVKKSEYIKIINNNITYDNLVKNNLILDSSNNVIIDNNKMKSIWISRSNNCILRNNKIFSSKDGISLLYSDNNKIERNLIDECKRRGIFLISANNNIIKNNNLMKIDKSIINLFCSLDRFRDFMYYDSATFLNSKGTKWIGNYWGEERILPKIIVGRTGKDGLIPVINVDWFPSKEPN